MLFRDDQLRQKLQRIIFDAFGLHLLIDLTAMSQFRYCFSKSPALSVEQEKSLNEASLSLFRAAVGIERMGDGVKAFTGLMAQAIAGDPLVLVIDEPEAFLHPSLAFKLGQELARAARAASRQIFVATHSASFLRGCIHSGVGVNIIRLTYEKEVATARPLPSAELLKITRDPVLRSAGLMNALFHPAVVVCEGDSDRVLYDEINERLLKDDPPRGVSDCLFIDSGGKDSIKRMVGSLRKLGIPAAAIVDLDIIKKEVDWPTLLTEFAVPQQLRSGIQDMRSKIRCIFESQNLDMAKGGVELLTGEDRRAADDLFDQLDGYGLFVVRCGALERWLAMLGVPPGHKAKWLPAILDKMGDDPSSPQYVKAGRDDIWPFVEKIRRWLKDPSRKGIFE